MNHPDVSVRCQRCGTQMDLKDPGPQDPWPPQQFWECPACNRHFWTTYPPVKPPKPKPAPKPAAKDDAAKPAPVKPATAQPAATEKAAPSAESTPAANPPAPPEKPADTVSQE